MWKSRLAWGIWLAGVSLLYLFTDSYGMLLVLLGSVLIPVVGIVVSRLAAKHVILSFSTEQTGSKGAGLSGILTAYNESILPCRIECILHCDNMLTGETVTPHLKFSLPGKTSEDIDFTCQSDFCGRIYISVEKLAVKDIFAISSTKVTSGAKARVTVYPDTFEPVLSVGTILRLDMDGAEYSTEKPGFDPSDVFAIREYKPGDSRKSIHWKLSQKLEQIMVRDPGLPLETSYMLLFETTCRQGTVRPEPEVLDSLAEVFCSVTQMMADSGIHHCIGWKDNVSGLFCQTGVDSTDELFGEIPGVLSAGFDYDELSVIDYYLESMDNEYAHVLYFSPYIPGNISDCADYAGHLSLFLCSGQDWPEALYGENISVLSFTSDNYQQELGCISI